MGVDRADRVRNECIGRVLREIRKDAGLSLEKAAARSGGQVGQGIISAYERGDRTVSLDRLIELAAWYEVSPRMLISVLEVRMRSEVDDPPVDAIV